MIFSVALSYVVEWQDSSSQGKRLQVDLLIIIRAVGRELGGVYKQTNQHRARSAARAEVETGFSQMISSQERDREVLSQWRFAFSSIEGRRASIQTKQRQGQTLKQGALLADEEKTCLLLSVKRGRGMPPRNRMKAEGKMQEGKKKRGTDFIIYSWCHVLN